MVTKVTRDVLDLTVRDITDGIKIIGNCGPNFAVDGTPIGLGTPCDGAFVNLSSINTTITGTLDVTGASITGLVTVPVGAVVMFNAAFATIPTNWQLCDGTNGTPDMTNQFVYGTNTEGELLDSGGSADAVVVQHDHTMNTTGAHTHTVVGSLNDGGNVTFDRGSTTNLANQTTSSSGNHSHNINDSGVSGVGMNLPPFIKLAYIQRMS